MFDVSLMYPSIDIDCMSQEQADELLVLFNDFKKEFEGMPVCLETKLLMQNRLLDIQYQLENDIFFDGVSFKLNGGLAFNEDDWYLEDIISYHQLYCKDNNSDYINPSYVDVNNMLFDLKMCGVLQAYSPVMPCLNTILSRYLKPFPTDKLVKVEVRYDSQEKK